MAAKLIILLSVVLAFAGLGWWGQSQRSSAIKSKAEAVALAAQLSGTKAALEKSEQDAKDKASVSLGRQKQINQLLAQAEVQSKALNEALKQNRAWADAAVPDGVWDAIAGPTSADTQAATRPGVDTAHPRAEAPGPR